MFPLLMVPQISIAATPVRAKVAHKVSNFIMNSGHVLPQVPRYLRFVWALLTRIIYSFMFNIFVYFERYICLACKVTSITIYFFLSVNANDMTF